MHNVSFDMFFRYDPETSALHHAHTFKVEADLDTKACDLIWILTNVDSANDLRLNYPHFSQYADQVTHYRQRKNRSLSVGDVIVLYERERFVGAFAVATVGFDPVAEPVNMEVATNDRDESDSYVAYRKFADAANRRT
jgi:hypothetical protein